MKSNCDEFDVINEFLNRFVNIHSTLQLAFFSGLFVTYQLRLFCLH